MNRNKDLSENIVYPVADIPVLTSENERLSELPTYRELIHWHNDFEFIMVKEGTMDFSVNESVLHIRSGQGLFVNSNRLHFGYSEARQEVLFDMVIISADMIQTRFNEREIDKLTDIHNTDYCFFYKNSHIWTALQQIISENREHKPFYGLSVQSLLCSVICELCLRVTDREYDESENISILRDILGYIHLHYAEKILISDITDNIFVSRNRCFYIFRKFMQMTPQQYITMYRLSKSTELLKMNMPVSEISKKCGYSTQSHFIKSFHEIYGVTPKQYQLKYFEELSGGKHQ